MNRNEKILISTIVAALSILAISVFPNASAQVESDIPPWVKIIAGAWYQGEVGDLIFLDAMSFLIENDILVIPIEVYEFTITTDKTSYTGDEIMIVSGTLPDYGSDSVVLMFTSPDNYIVGIANILSDGDGAYSTTMQLGGEAMDKDGMYTLVASYDGETVQTAILYSME